MATYNAGWSTGLLRAALRATYATTHVFVDMYLRDSADSSNLRYKSISASDWNAAANGEIQMAGLPVATSATNSGTLSRFRIAGSGGATLLTSAAAGAVDTTLSSEIVVSSTSTAANPTITDLRVGFPKTRGSVSINMALRNKLCELLVGKHVAHISANGTIKVYSGSAPDVDVAATGTEMWSANVDTTSSFTWADVSSDACALNSSLVATSLAFGANLVAGYARLTWTKDAIVYVVQGTVGEATGSFQFSNLDGGSNNEMIQSTSYTMNNATISFA